MFITDTHSRYMVQLGLLPQDYENLQAAESDIIKAFKLQALLHHPDRNRGRETEASERFRAADEAREELMAALGGLNIESEHESDGEESCGSRSNGGTAQTHARRANASHLRDELLRAEAHRTARAAEATRQQSRAAARALQAAHLQAQSAARQQAAMAQAAKAVEQRRAAAEVRRREAVHRAQQQRVAQQQWAEQRARAQQLSLAGARERYLAWLAHQRDIAALELIQREKHVLKSTSVDEGVSTGSSTRASGASNERQGLQRAEITERDFDSSSPSYSHVLKRWAAVPTYLELRARVGGRTIFL